MVLGSAHLQMSPTFLLTWFETRAKEIEHRSGRADVALQLLETALSYMLGSDAERVLYALAVGAAPTRGHDDPDADTDAEARKRAAALAEQQV